MKRKILNLLLLLFLTTQAVAEPTKLLQRYQGLLSSIPASTIAQLAEQIRQAKPQLYATFFSKDLLFANLNLPSCAPLTGPWLLLGQGYFSLALLEPQPQRAADFFTYAKVAYLTGMGQSPACPYYTLALAELYLAEQKPYDALLLLEEVKTMVSSGPVANRFWIDQAITYDLLGKNGLAKQAFSKVADDGHLPAAYDYHHAHALLLNKQWSEAQAAIAKAQEKLKHPSASWGAYPLNEAAVATLQRIITYAAILQSAATR